MSQDPAVARCSTQPYASPAVILMTKSMPFRTDLKGENVRHVQSTVKSKANCSFENCEAKLLGFVISYYWRYFWTFLTHEGTCTRVGTPSIPGKSTPEHRLSNDPEVSSTARRSTYIGTSGMKPTMLDKTIDTRAQQWEDKRTTEKLKVEDSQCTRWKLITFRRPKALDLQNRLKIDILTYHWPFPSRAGFTGRRYSYGQ